MRFIIGFLTVLFMTAPSVVVGQTRADATLSLVKWTTKNWKEREELQSLPGVYTKCGNYIFTYTPAIGETKAPTMFGFGIANVRGGIDMIVVTDARNGRVRIREDSEGVSPSVVPYSTNPERSLTGYIVFLPPKEHALVEECLGVKKFDPNKKSPRITNTQLHSPASRRSFLPHFLLFTS